MILELQHIYKNYDQDKLVVPVLKDVSLQIEEGEYVAIMGPSGSVKTTLMNIVGCLDLPTSGTYILDGRPVSELKEKELTKVRRDTIGFVFQNFQLMPRESALDNVCLPLIYAGVSKKDRRQMGMEALERVGLSDRADFKPTQLSGGQKQRVAIARALAAETHYLLCDEATSALDPDTTRSVLELLKKINRTLGVTIIVITHEMKVIDSICDRVAVLDNSTVAEIGDVRTVFANPRSDIAKKLIMPQGELPVTSEHGKKIRIIYNGENSSKSLLSDMILKCSTPVNILHADTKDIDGKAYGQILVQLPDDDTSAEKITAYLKANNVTYSQV